MKKNRSGTTVIEILMSITILLIGMTGVMALFPMGVKLTQQSLDDSISALTAQNALSDIRAQAGLLDHLLPYTGTQLQGDTLFWNPVTNASNGMDGACGAVSNVGGSWLGKSRIEPSLYRSGTQVSASIPRDGLAAWFDAGGSMIYSSGSIIKTWQDRSGNGRDATTLTGGTPTLVQGVIGGRPVVRFSDDTSNAGSTLRFSRLTNIRSVFWVLKDSCTNTAHRHFLLGDSSGANLARGVNPGPAGTKTGYVWGTPASEAVTSGTTRLNGDILQDPNTHVQTATSTCLPAGQFCIVSLVTTWEVAADTLTRCDVSPGYPSWYGDIAEVIIYTRDLSTTEEASVGSYLASKYGIQTSYGTTTGAGSEYMFTTKENGATQPNDKALLLMTSGKAIWKLYRLDSDTVFSPALISSTVNGCTDVPGDGIVIGDAFNLIGARTIDHVWVTAPANFYGTGSGPPANGKYTLGKGAADGYGYLAIIERMEGSPDCFRIYILVYKNYDETRPPEGNAPAIACYTTIVSREMIR